MLTEFERKYWTEKLGLENTSVRVKGNHYQFGTPILADRTTYRGMLGFNGHIWKVKFFDDRPQIITNNLWHQGKIPDEFKDKLPDNAEFV